MYDSVTKPFSTRVLDRVAPKYSKVIKHPMDLSKIRRKLEAPEAYKSPAQARADIALVKIPPPSLNIHPRHPLLSTARF
jgi:hypothetical protein